jgi:hypothetical protein
MRPPLTAVGPRAESPLCESSPLDASFAATVCRRPDDSSMAATRRTSFWCEENGGRDRGMQNLVLWRGYLTFTIITVGDSSISTLTVPIIFLPSILRFGYKFNTLAGVARHLSGPRWIAVSRAWKMTFPAPTSSSSSLFPVTYTWDPHVQLSPTSSHQAL